MLEKFIEQLLQEKGMPAGIDPEVRTQLVKDLTTKVEDLINRRMIDSLNDDQVVEFNHLLDSDPSAEAVHEFVDKNVSNKEEVTAAALLEFRELYLGNG